MAGDASFDVVSDFDRQELVNALDQVRREVTTRYDFKGATADIELNKDDVTLTVDSDLRAHALRELIESKAIKRGLSLKVFDWGDIQPVGGSLLKQKITLRKGLPDDIAKKITRMLRDDFPKVKSQIQGDAVRVTAKSKDELQRVIARLREDGEGYPVALQFTNYR
jgi:uncharacterized protein YajQ (UPF0234 family)